MSAGNRDPNERAWHGSAASPRQRSQRLAEPVARGRARERVTFVGLPMAGEGDRVFAGDSRDNPYESSSPTICITMLSSPGPKQER